MHVTSEQTKRWYWKRVILNGVDYELKTAMLKEKEKTNEKGVQ